MFQVVIMVCAMGIAHPDCQPDTATSVTFGQKVANPLQCGLFGQASIAATAIAPVEGREYAKIACVRRETVEASR